MPSLIQTLVLADLIAFSMIGIGLTFSETSLGKVFFIKISGLLFIIWIPISILWRVSLNMWDSAALVRGMAIGFDMSQTILLQISSAITLLFGLYLLMIGLNSSRRSINVILLYTIINLLSILTYMIFVSFGLILKVTIVPILGIGAYITVIECLREEDTSANLQQIQDRTKTAWEFYNSAKIYRSEYNWDQAFDALNESITIFKEIDNDDGVSASLFQLILMNLDLNKKDQVELYSRQLNQMKSLRDKTIIIRKRLVKALILKYRPRAMDKVDSQRNLQKIISETVINRELTIIAMISLCELLLDEWRAYGGEEEVLRDIDILLGNLHNLSQDYESPEFFIDILLLRARFDLFRGNLTNAETSLSKAISFTEEKEFEELFTRVKKEMTIFKKNRQKWEYLSQEGASITERLKESELHKYLKETINNL
jgi:tetratricopeptide (TPR) repeat protein